MFSDKNTFRNSIFNDDTQKCEISQAVSLYHNLYKIDLYSESHLNISALGYAVDVYDIFKSSIMFTMISESCMRTGNIDNPEIQYTIFCYMKYPTTEKPTKEMQYLIEKTTNESYMAEYKLKKIRNIIGNDIFQLNLFI